MVLPESGNCPKGSKSDLPVQVRQTGFIYKPHHKMPKVKTNSSAKKRFKVTGTGEITFQKAFKRHILTKKSTKRKRLMAKKGKVSSANQDFVKRLLRLK
jgi:large subunit ribosomal protein L35